MILTLQSDFIIMARAKGISPRRMLWVHALRMSHPVADHERGAADGGAASAARSSPSSSSARRASATGSSFAVQQNDLLVDPGDRRHPRRRSSCSPTSSSTCSTPSSTRASASPGRSVNERHDDARRRSAAERCGDARAESAIAEPASAGCRRSALIFGVALARRCSCSSPCSPTTCRSSAAPSSGVDGRRQLRLRPRRATSGSAATASAATCSPAASTAPASR